MKEVLTILKPNRIISVADVPSSYTAIPAGVVSNILYYNKTSLIQEITIKYDTTVIALISLSPGESHSFQLSPGLWYADGTLLAHVASTATSVNFTVIA